MKRRNVVINGIKYSSITEACYKLHCTYNTIIKQLNTDVDIVVPSDKEHWLLKKNISERVGMVKIMDDGHKGEIIAYRNAYDIDVRWENGIITEHCRWAPFKNGNLHALGDFVQRKGTAIATQDHTGRLFESKADKVKFWGISKSTYEHRIKRGWSEERALTTPERITKVHVIYKEKEYKSLFHLCKSLHISYENIKSIREENPELLLDEIIDAYIKSHKKDLFFIGPDGIVYSSLLKCCEILGANYDRVRRRLSNGDSVEEAFSLEKRNVKAVCCKDHNGVEYPSKRAMCDAYNTSWSLVARRLSSGWTLKDALETPKVRTNIDVSCFIGEKTVANNGLSAECIDVIRGDGERKLLIIFEDGIKTRCSTQEFKLGKITHPELKVNRRCMYKGFDAKRIFSNLYECECRKCKLKDILTPQQMMEHAKECQ